MIISMLLFVLACWIEGVYDVYDQVYKLNLIDWKGVDKLNKNWWSYNPLAPEKGLGIMRDGWHFLKAVHYALIIAAICTAAVDVLGFGVSALYAAPILILIRWIVFKASLRVNEKRITPQNNFR